VKDERNLDKFDACSGHVFKGLETDAGRAGRRNPTEWLKKLADKFSREEKKQIEAMGVSTSSWRRSGSAWPSRRKRHQGGITSGSAPKALRRSATRAIIPKAFASARRQQELPRGEGLDKREFQGPRDEVELGTRNIKVALRRLRKFAPHRPR